MPQQRFLIEKVIGHEIENGKMKLKILWRGYPVSQATLEPAQKMLREARALVKDYLRGLSPGTLSDPPIKKVADLARVWVTQAVPVGRQRARGGGGARGRQAARRGARQAARGGARQAARGGARQAARGGAGARGRQAARGGAGARGRQAARGGARRAAPRGARQSAQAPVQAPPGPAPALALQGAQRAAHRRGGSHRGQARQAAPAVQGAPGAAHRRGGARRGGQARLAAPAVPGAPGAARRGRSHGPAVPAGQAAPAAVNGQAAAPAPAAQDVLNQAAPGVQGARRRGVRRGGIRRLVGGVRRRVGVRLRGGARRGGQARQAAPAPVPVQALAPAAPAPVAIPAVVQAALNALPAAQPPVPAPIQAAFNQAGQAAAPVLAALPADLYAAPVQGANQVLGAMPAGAAVHAAAQAIQAAPPGRYIINGLVHGINGPQEMVVLTDVMTGQIQVLGLEEAHAIFGFELLRFFFYQGRN